METNMIWFFAILLALVLPFTIFCGVMGAKDPNKKRLDERQLAIESYCYKVTFAVLVGYYGIYGIADVIFPKYIATLGYVGIFTGLIMGVMVLSVLTLIKGAYFAPGANKKAQYWLNGGMLALWTLNFCLSAGDGLIKNGRLSAAVMYLEFMLCYGVILVTQLIIARREKKRPEEEE